MGTFQPFLSLSAVSYEGSLFGIDVEVNPSSDEIIRAKMGFGFHETPGSLKAAAVSSSGRYLICGGMDEYIRIFDLKEKRSAGEMSGHTGCITSLAFVGDKFVISGSEDGTMIIWRASNWQKLHILGGHKGPVHHFALHSSGKLCVSVSKDNTMKIWNLVHGRCAFTRRLKGAADRVGWHKSLDFYFLVVGNEVQVYDSENNNECTATISCGSRVNNACFVDVGASANNNISKKGVHVAIICENKTLRIMDETGSAVGPVLSLAKSFKGARPKDLFACRANANTCSSDLNFATFMEGEGDCLTVASSAGHLEVLSALKLSQGDDYSGDDEDPLAFARLSSFKIDAEPRLTAVVAYDPAPPTQKSVESEVMTGLDEGVDEGKRKRAEEEGKNKKNKKNKKKPKTQHADD